MVPLGGPGVNSSAQRPANPKRSKKPHTAALGRPPQGSQPVGQHSPQPAPPQGSQPGSPQLSHAVPPQLWQPSGQQASQPTPPHAPQPTGQHEPQAVAQPMLCLRQLRPQPMMQPGMHKEGGQQHPVMPASTVIVTSESNIRFMSCGPFSSRTGRDEGNSRCHGPLEKTSVRQPAESRKSSEPLLPTRLVRPVCAELASRAVK
jgi:hypothetical protein